MFEPSQNQTESDGIPNAITVDTLTQPYAENLTATPILDNSKNLMFGNLTANPFLKYVLNFKFLKICSYQGC